MAYPIDFTGCKAMISDEETGAFLAKATVREFDRDTVSMTVGSRFLDSERHDRVAVLLFRSGAVYEFQGRVRKTQSQDSVEIALFKGRRKEDRSARRYTVNAPALVEQVVIDGGERQLSEPLEIVVRNVSVNGLLIRTGRAAFRPGMSFKMRINIGGTDTVITASIVREELVEDYASEYGCKVIFVG